MFRGQILVFMAVIATAKSVILEKLSSCSCYLPNGTMVDISALAGSGGEPKYKDETDQSSTLWRYSYNPCVPFSQIPPKGEQGTMCNDVALCQHSRSVPGIRGYYFNIGIQDTVIYELKSANSTQAIISSVTSYRYDVMKHLRADSDEHVTFTYYDKAQSAERTSMVILICSPVSDFVAVGQIPSSSPSQFIFMLSDPAACPVAYVGGGLSVGWILCILFVTGLVVYCMVGVLIMKFVKHAHGTDVIPNKSFWVAIPRCIRDGCIFACSKVRGSQRDPVPREDHETEWN